MEDSAERLGFRQAPVGPTEDNLCGACGGKDHESVDQGFQKRFCSKCGARFKIPLIIKEEVGV